MNEWRAVVEDWLRRHPLRAVLVALAGITALTGLAEILAPATLLSLLGAEPAPLATQLFATVGLFMMVVGGLLTQSLLRRTPHRDVVFWSGLQKAGAVVAVTVGVLNGVFGPIALLVAAFDLATAVLLFLYWKRLQGRIVSQRPTTPQRNDDRS
ncbi:hypothetical protein [Cryobacterium roopkundense]|uniref:Lysylphosphatidylglycerol synthetase-like protein (DUF2156 family) n=1 Tax=Cryobacterium roopkundense TaxID=1001240 RepID=A0A7W8ZXH2_9MICO|nr:hypothetical protein [Cryobacterium roopkundense]MBB5642044.1 lysylphosphatidylglycerol synthetase-like protein (DUF2156 family) [Cryobacterium roopkundense]